MSELEGGPSSCGTLDWISVVDGWITACSMSTAIASRPARRHRIATGCAGSPDWWMIGTGVRVREALESMNGARFVRHA